MPLPRVRREPPTVPEAIIAAQGLTDDVDEQVAIAAGLMGAPEDEIRPYLPRPAPRNTSSLTVRNRVVMVERRGSRADQRQRIVQVR